jgi:tRNA(His) 5'-end guanylyltransferase
MQDTLGDRIKSKYEDVFRNSIPQRTFAVIRIDGKAFHTFTKTLEKPHSAELSEAMDHAAQVLCKEMMGCKLAYGQSDEYSFLLTDFEKEESEMWFNGNIQKIVSVSSSIFTAAFNDHWEKVRPMSFKPRLAMFDARVFVIPSRNDVFQYFLWRQKDASRNSLTMLASCHFSHKQLHGQDRDAKHELLQSVGVKWTDWPTSFRHGRVVRRVSQQRTVSYVHKKTKEKISKDVEESVWQVDREIPVFTRTSDYLDSVVPHLR